MSAMASEEFGPEVLLIFIGHSGDANASADVIRGLERELQDLLNQHLSVSGTIPFKTIRMWEWRKDASHVVGGQEKVVAAAIKRANIAVFVFREKIGTVSWAELNQSRNREHPAIPVLAFFPSDSPPNLNDEIRIEKWLDLVKKRGQLTEDWSAPNSRALRPLEQYQDLTHLKTLAEEQLRKAVLSLLKSEPHAKGPIPVAVLPAKFLGDQSHLSYDRQPVLTRSLSELDRDLLNDFLAKPLSRDLGIDSRRGREGTSPSDSEQLESLGCLYSGHPTLGALLCFAPAQLLADKSGCCTLQMAIHDGAERGGEKASISLARGNLLFLYHEGMSWLTGGAVLRKKGRIGSDTRDDLEIPEIVIREALVNALVHRDYESKILQEQPTRIDVYPDKIEITSYGRLLIEVPIELLNSPDQSLRPFRRNPVIATIFQCMTLAELNASGVQRMRREMSNRGLALPLFRTGAGFVCVTLARPFDVSTAPEGVQSVLKIPHAARKAFIGSTAELSEHRAAAQDACLRAGLMPIMSEQFMPMGMDISSASEHMIDEADLYILIIGNRNVSTRDGISFVEMVFNRAVELGSPILAFTMHPDHPVTIDAVQTDAGGRERLEHFKKRISQQHLSAEFKSPQDLRNRIIEALVSLPGPAVLETKPGLQADVSRIMKYAPSNLIGREAETKLLSDAWNHVVRGETKRPHILTFVALGGEGKTSVVAKWAVDLAFREWPGCEAVLAWSFYSQGTREQLAASSDLFINEALTFFGDAKTASSAAGAFDKGRRLAQLVGERRALLILDGLEPLQYAPTSPTPGELKDQGIAALLKGLAANSRGLCVVTTRYSIPDLRAYVGKTVVEQKLPRLSTEAGVALLQSFGVKGSLRKTIPSPGGEALWNEFEKLVEDVKGHALTLNLLGSYLRDAHGGDIRKRDLIRLSEANAEEQGGDAFRVMDAYVATLANVGKTANDKAQGERALALLRLLGLFDRPATAASLAALWHGEGIAGLTEPLIGISEAQRNLALKRLEDAKLITVIREHGSGTLVALDAHPLLREYFGQRLREAQPEAWRAAHRRIYEHLCAGTADKTNATLEDLQPLYQAVAHGCQAGWQQEAYDKVYFDRIARGDEAYAVKKLGAFGSDLAAVACFFAIPWSLVSPELTEAAQAWLLNQAAFSLRALGRLTEALEPMRAGLKMRIKQEVWKSAAINASNLSELELTLGEVDGAVGDAEQSVTYADRSGDVLAWVAFQTTHADALHQAGRREEAEARFREAERMQSESQPAYPLLYSLGGFRYCELLLSAMEREAGTAVAKPIEKEGLASYRAIAERAAHTLRWAEQHNLSLLSIALDHLTLGRAALYAAIIESRGDQHAPAQVSPPPVSEEGQRVFRTASLELDHAVSGLRRAGTQDHLPRGLLTRAWLRSLTGPRTGPESAQSDLDEAWEIAERGPMPLFLADIHLYRARLFFRDENYPWESPQHDLAEARRLIFKHGYLRRKEELEDAEAALEHFANTATPPRMPGRRPPGRKRAR